ncbi:MAG: cell division protein ZapE [Gemmatimonas sp.]
MSPGPLAIYRERRQAGVLAPDPAQALAAEKLESLARALAGYRPRAAEAQGWLARFGLRPASPRPPQGLYLYGAVGRGKSMLMDLFYESAPVAARHRRRVHFHTFMQEVHQRMHALRGSGETADIIGAVADEVAAKTWLLCFDEFQVTNIADAMILGRLFEALFERGVVVVATSNRSPDQLYERGLQRELFLPFIALIKNKLDVLCLDGETDWRRARIRGMKVYHVPLGRAAAEALDAAFRTLTDDDADAGPATLTVLGRTLEIPLAARGVARFSFEELCARALGAADYFALATHFHTLILAGIPRMNADRRNEAIRFTTLIDALYEHRVNLVCSAEAPPDELYTEGEGSFEFHRTASRLIEMQSEAYQSAEHMP